MQRPELTTSSTRNSPLRSIGKPIIDGGVNLMRRYTPQLRPDHLNYAMIAGSTIGAALSYRAEKRTENRVRNKVVAGVLLAGSSLLDGFDGALARRLDAEGIHVDFKRGAIKDARGDRIRNAIVGVAIEEAAHARGSESGVYWERLRQITNPLSSLFRAANEERGVAVREGGVDAVSFFGTEVGRTAIGIVEATVPDVCGTDVQAHLARFSTIANVYSAARRVHEGLTVRPTLNPEDRKSAAERKRALALTTIAVSGIPVLTEYIRRQRSRKILQSDDELNSHYRSIVRRIEIAGQEFLDGEHRFVGSIFPDLIKYHREDGRLIIDSEIEYDFKEREIRIKNHNPMSLRRDEDNTMKDVDLVLLSTDQTRRDHFEGFRRGVLGDAAASGMPFAHIGAEAAFYPEGRRKRQGWRQLVSAFEIDAKGRPHLVFDDIDFEISRESVEGWKVVLEDGLSYTMFNPLAQWLCYHVRTPISGPKNKDVESGKIDLLEEVARQFFATGMKLGINYADIHENWFQYISKVLDDKRLSFRLRSVITKFWWTTVGTSVSHGHWPYGAIVNRSGGFEG